MTFLLTVLPMVAVFGCSLVLGFFLAALWERLRAPRQPDNKDLWRK